jgi:hypothetical protein
MHKKDLFRAIFGVLRRFVPVRGFTEHVDRGKIALGAVIEDSGAKQGSGAVLEDGKQVSLP